MSDAVTTPHAEVTTTEAKLSGYRKHRHAEESAAAARRFAVRQAWTRLGPGLTAAAIDRDGTVASKADWMGCSVAQVWASLMDLVSQGLLRPGLGASDWDLACATDLAPKWGAEFRAWIDGPVA